MILYSKSHKSDLNFDLIMPLLDLRILVKPLRASWLNLCMQVLFSDTVCVVALKLHTLNQCNQMTLYAKYHNSELNFD